MQLILLHNNFDNIDHYGLDVKILAPGTGDPSRMQVSSRHSSRR